MSHAVHHKKMLLTPTEENSGARALRWKNSSASEHECAEVAPASWPPSRGAVNGNDRLVQGHLTDHVVIKSLRKARSVKLTA